MSSQPPKDRRLTPVDYDAPRPSPVNDTDDGLEALTPRRGKGDDDDTAGLAGPPDPDPVDEELSVPVVPMRGDEFRCERCFLVHHRSRLAVHRGVQLCRDCA